MGRDGRETGCAGSSGPKVTNARQVRSNQCGTIATGETNGGPSERVNATRQCHRGDGEERIHSGKGLSRRKRDGPRRPRCDSAGVEGSGEETAPKKKAVRESLSRHQIKRESTMRQKKGETMRNSRRSKSNGEGW